MSNPTPRLIAAQTTEDAPWPTLPIIGIAGHALAGKNTVAEFIKEQYRCMSYAFAEPIKGMLSILGLTPYELHGGWKDEVSQDFQTTPRHMMQTLGTEWGRDTINENIWVITAERRLNLLNRGRPGATILITDVRFQNEADFVRQHGFLIHVERPVKRIKGSDHRSETRLSIKNSDHVIINDGDLDHLREEALRVAHCISTDVKRRLEVRHAS